MAKLTVNQTIPNFKFNTAYQNDQQLHDILKGKTVFWVIRYIGCTVCRYDVHELARQYEMIKTKGAQVYVVMQSDQDHVKQDLDQVELPFDIICDDNLAIYKALEINPAADMAELAGDKMDQLQEKAAKAKECGFVHGDYEGDELQLPALFIVDQNGRVEHAHYGRNIVDMPTVAQLIEML